MIRLIGGCSIALLLVTRAWGQGDTGGAGEDKQPSESREAEITPSHALQRVAQLRGELESIRLEMGKPTVNPPPIQVTDAAPREVYFQAITLFRKADRLAFEHTGVRVAEPPIPEGAITPAHVRAMADAALGRILSVKEALAITEESEVPPLNEGTEPSEVFLSIMSANREINNLLDRRVSPGDVYQQVTVAIAYMARLLDAPGQVSTPPSPPPFERRKRPADVYRRLAECFEMIRLVGEKSGVPMLQITMDEEKVERVEPSDVYDIASLLVSELAYLHRQKPGVGTPRKRYHPGRKLPSHVYQRIGILFGQLEALKLKLESDPDWFQH